MTPTPVLASTRSLRPPALLLSALALLTSPAFGQPAVLVKDINTAVLTDTHLSPTQGVVANGILYFTGGDEASGRELWRSDGTFEGTRIVVDMRPGPDGVGSTSALAVGTDVLFVGNDGSGWDIWRTDGTIPGLTRVTSFRAAQAPGLYGVYGANVLFSYDDPAVGFELWITDGTSAGTRLVKDIQPGPGSSRPNRPVLSGSWIYFTADDGTTGVELWRTDGTESGTSLVKDINPQGNSDAYFKAALGGTVFFGANDGSHGTELWKTDGTAAGTVLVKDISPGAFGSSPRLGDVLGGRFFFWAHQETTGVELWSTDGTEAGTQLLVELTPGNNTLGGVSMIRLGSLLLFDYEYALWRTDGTAAGTQRVVPGGGPEKPGLPVRTANGVYWRATPSFGHVELWRTDGTAAGTVRVGVMGPSGPPTLPPLMVAFGEGLAYAIETEDGSDLWYADADENRPVRARGPWAASSQPASVVEINGRSLLTARDERGRELWQTDATAAGTTLLRDFCVGCPESQYSGGPSLGPILDGRLLIGAADVEHGYELWTSDGTAAGTTLAFDLAAGPQPGGPYFMSIHEGSIYFLAYVNGYGLFRWRPGQPPVRLDDAFASHPPASLGHQLLYGAGELMRTDGTPEGTVLVKDLQPGVHTSSPRELVRFRNHVYFQAATDAGDEMWRTDGTTTGTQLVKDICPGLCFPQSGVYTYVWPTPGRDALFFVQTDGVNGRELWKTDGTAAGTVMVKDIHPTGSSDPSGLAVMNGRLYFAADDGVHGRELWTSDGTAAGTTMVRDVNPGPSSGMLLYPYLADIGGVLLFAGHRRETGVELWRSDGTAAGTYALQDIAPGPASSLPYVLGRVGLRIYLSANDGVHGRELFSLLAFPRYSAQGTSADEGGVARFEVRAEGVTSAPLVVRYQTTDLTAVAGKDYEPVVGLLTFTPSTPPQVVEVPTLADASEEPLEVFALDLQLEAGGGGPQSLRVEATVADDDVSTVVASPATIVEGDAGTTSAAVAVELRTAQGAPSTRPIVVSFEASPSTATEGLDFDAVQGSLTFPAGWPSGASQAASVPVRGDTIDEPDEQFAVRVFDQSSTSHPQEAAVRIQDDDGAQTTETRELAHGTLAWGRLAPAGATVDRDWYLLEQQPHASYEVVLDAISGDVQPIHVERLAADGTTVLASAAPAGTGSTVSLRWQTGTSVVRDQKVVVRSGGCEADCGADDVYRLRAYETTATIPRYYNDGNLRTFVLMHNPTAQPIAYHVAAWRADGSSGGMGIYGNLAPLASAVHQVFDTASGSLTVAHDGPYGGLVGKAVTVDSATGSSFDSPMTYRPR
jgi:ELWxxDGT repeat protein